MFYNIENKFSKILSQLEVQIGENKRRIAVSGDVIDRLIAQFRHGGNLFQLQNTLIFADDGLLRVGHFQHSRLVSIQHQNVPQHTQHQLQELFLILSPLPYHVIENLLRLIVLHRGQWGFLRKGDNTVENRLKLL